MPILEAKQRTRMVIFFTIFLTVVYTLSGVFTAWANEVQEEQVNLIGENSAVYENRITNYTTPEDMQQQATDTEGISGWLYGALAVMTFQSFLELAYIGFALTIFFNLVTGISWTLLILIGISYIHEWIPFLN